jgi:hypothetical protein
MLGAMSCMNCVVLLSAIRSNKKYPVELQALTYLIRADTVCTVTSGVGHFHIPVIHCLLNYCQQLK